MESLRFAVKSCSRATFPANFWLTFLAGCRTMVPIADTPATGALFLDISIRCTTCHRKFHWLAESVEPAHYVIRGRTAPTSFLFLSAGIPIIRLWTFAHLQGIWKYKIAQNAHNTKKCIKYAKLSTILGKWNNFLPRFYFLNYIVKSMNSYKNSRFIDRLTETPLTSIPTAPIRVCDDQIFIFTRIGMEFCNWVNPLNTMFP